MKARKRTRAVSGRVLSSPRSERPAAYAEHDALKLVSNLARGSEALLAAGVSERDVYSQILRAAVVGNPAYLGLWLAFEPDVIEGPDICFAGAPGHDPSGRFIPYWNRADGELRLDVVTGLDHTRKAPWYFVPKDHLQPCTAEPYLYPIAGQPRWIASAIAPITSSGKCIGVIGVDWDASSRTRVDSHDPTEAIVHVNGEALAADRLNKLTPREREVYHWLTQGKSNEEISIILGISAHTVKNHLDHIFQKLGVCNRLAAALVVQGGT